MKEKEPHNFEEVDDWLQDELTKRFGWLTVRYNNYFEVMIRLNKELDAVRFVFVLN